MQPIRDRRVERRIDRFEDQGVHRQRLGSHERGSAAHGDTNDADALAWRRFPQKSERGLSIQALERTERDVPTRALAMRLKSGARMVKPAWWRKASTG